MGRVGEDVVRIAGVLPPIPTPFSDDEVNIKALRLNVKKWMATRIRGVVVLGSNGEAPLLDEEESVAVIEATREQVPSDRLCIAGTGRETTKGVIEATRRAAEVGVDAVLVRTPSFFKTLLTPDALTTHYVAVADASPVPVLLYNFTALTGVTLGVDVVSVLSEHPNIIGMKESGSDLKFVSALVDQTPDEFFILTGSAPVFYPSLVVGASGGILALASVVPDLCVELYELTRAGQADQARQLQRRISPLASLVTSIYGVPGLKAALSLLGFDVGPPRAPLCSVSTDAVNAIRKSLEKLEMPMS